LGILAIGNISNNVINDTTNCNKNQE
jgi:hypothetical protein